MGSKAQENLYTENVIESIVKVEGGFTKNRRYACQKITGRHGKLGDMIRRIEKTFSSNKGVVLGCPDVNDWSVSMRF